MLIHAFGNIIKKQRKAGGKTTCILGSDYCIRQRHRHAYIFRMHDEAV